MIKKIFFVFLIITLFLFSTFIYSKAVQDLPIIIESPKKVSAPVFSAAHQNLFSEAPSFCSGYICLPPGETPFSLNLNQLSLHRESYDYSSTTVDNKIGTSPVIGTYSIPVLLVKFSDMVAPSNLTQSIYNDIFNSSNYLSGNGISVSKFYKHNSYDQLNITFDVYDWRQAPQNYGFYVTNTHQLVVDTINLFGTGPNAIDFTQYDSDNDGRIDGFIIVHAGFPAQEQSGNIPAQARIYKNSSFTIQGKFYGNAAIIPSRHPSNFCNNWISMFNYPSDCRLNIEYPVHEFAHVLGLPDLYELSYTGIQLSHGLGGHTVMVASSDKSQDAKKPVNFDMWSKFFFGWITPTIIDSAEQANIYSLNAYDTNPEVFLLRNPETMNDREFFLVTNRYISNTSLDRYLFGIIPPTFNVNGGLDIFHVDEAYIDLTYSGPIAFNSIMHDPDGDYYDDVVSHPGIVFEQNVLDVNYSPQRYYNDLYTNESANFHPVVHGIFDDIERILPDPPNYIIRDTTSTTYNGLVDSGIRVEALSSSGYTMQAYLTVAPPLDLIAEIVTPESTSYGLGENINFIGSYQNNIGNADCFWFYTQINKENDSIFSSHKLFHENKTNRGDLILLSNECSFSGTPTSFGFQEGDYEIFFRVIDEFLREAEDSITINVVFSTTLYNQILDPVEGFGYGYQNSINFNSVYFNNQGSVSCVWKYQDIVLSNACNFSATPQELGLGYSLPEPGLSLFSKTSLDLSPSLVEVFSPSTILPQINLFSTSLESKDLSLSNSFFKKEKVIPSSLKNDFLKSPIIPFNRGVNYTPNLFPSNLYRTITLTTTDNISSYTSQVNLKVAMFFNTSLQDPIR